ncbi:hypothetical protein BTH42_00740 [Burkholderia sp. SRS-W-2-2016]|uniref:hypothetical protein n=1 Tax=Burkholderia sp. SRS-W-2-2016 TaxID=1926878 RepID=UPI00094ADDC4|nr:hypothetical protein [Burkholderia sp. SRS-W-2-2016]OLL33554.1 hypothetical protein BTH42_00740 [Burkholderia sp. SRS-W-2-2016]
MSSNPSAATVRRRNNREKWRETRRFSGFSFEAVMYDRAKATWQEHREQFGDAIAGRSTFTDWVAASIIAFAERDADEQAAHVAAYMNAENARRAAASIANTAAPDSIAAPAASPAVDAAGESPFDFDSLHTLSDEASS